MATNELSCCESSQRIMQQRLPDTSWLSLRQSPGFLDQGFRIQQVSCFPVLLSPDSVAWSGPDWLAQNPKGITRSASPASLSAIAMFLLAWAGVSQPGWNMQAAYVLRPLLLL